MHLTETKISTGCGTSLKEKEGFLGFFRTSKKNKVNAIFVSLASDSYLSDSTFVL